jgi:hypothetical protein
MDGEARPDEYGELYEQFVGERGIDHDPAGWSDDDVAAWRQEYRRWEDEGRDASAGVPPLPSGSMDFESEGLPLEVAAIGSGVWAVRRPGDHATLAILTETVSVSGPRFTLLGPGVDVSGPDWRGLLQELPPDRT